MTMVSDVQPSAVDAEELRSQIQEKYAEVAGTPEKGFHFHTGTPLAKKLGYPDEAVALLPASAVDSFAGTGNPFQFGDLNPGENVVDVGSGAGFDSLQAARHVGDAGRVIGVDMTQSMLQKASEGAASVGLANVEFREGLAESLPVEDGWADVVISNGVINLTPDKISVLKEISRVLKPGGRVQIGDIAVEIEVPQTAKDDIDLWFG
jgi:SAM-dependent methyltransferase